VRFVAVLLAALVLVPAGASTASSPGCSPSELQRLVRGYATALARGDTARLDRIFAAEPAFQWYSSPRPGNRLGDRAYDRSTLIPYFRARHAAAERVRFTDIRGGYDPVRRLGGFGFHALRRADDFRGGRWFRTEGKGAVDCSRHPLRVIVLSYGPAGRDA
jgi:hypothetical protein